MSLRVLFFYELVTGRARDHPVMEIVTVPDTKSLSESGSLSLRLSEWLDLHGVFLPTRSHTAAPETTPLWRLFLRLIKLSQALRGSLSHTHICFQVM